MKTRFTRLASLLTMAAIALSGCSKDDAADRTLPEEGAKIKVAANAVIPATRVNVGEYDGAEFPLTWGAGDGLAVVETSQTYGNNGAAVPEFVIATGEGEKTATFTGEIARTETEYYAVYPHSVLFQSAPDYHDFNLTFPDVQTPTAESLVDPAAVVLVSEAATLGEGGSLDFAFKHVAAYAKMTLKNLGEGKIESVVFAAPNYISGSYYYYYDNSLDHRSPENAYSKKEITIMADNLTVEDGVCEVMFAMLPCTLEKFSVTVNYSDGTAPMKRNCTPATAIEFAEGNVKGFTVDMAKEEPKPEEYVYKLITNANDITDGDYIIVGTTSAGDFAMPSSSVSGTINAEQITISEDTIASNDADGFVWTFKGNASSFTIHNGSNYLGWNSGSNFASGGNNTNWKAEYKDDRFVITNIGAGNRCLVYRYSNQYNRFGAYVDSNINNTEYYGVRLFKKDVGGSAEPGVPSPVLTLLQTEVDAEVEGDIYVVNYTLTNPVDDATVDAVADVDWIDDVYVNEDDNEIWISVTDNDGGSRSGTVTVTYSNLPPQTITVNQKGAGSDELGSIKLTNENIVKTSGNSDSSQNTAYKVYKFTDDYGYDWNANCICTYHSKATNTQFYIQIRKGEYYVQVPDTGKAIKKIVMTVSSASAQMSGGGNTSTLLFSEANNTNADTNSAIASATGSASVTIDMPGNTLTTGYINAGGAVRIWDIEVFY